MLWVRNRRSHKSARRWGSGRKLEEEEEEGGGRSKEMEGGVFEEINNRNIREMKRGE